MKRREFSQKRNRIIATAKTLFLENGYNQTSVDEIIQKVDISKGTFYHYFVTKIDLLEAVISDMALTLKEGLESTTLNSKFSAVQKLNKYFALSSQFRIKDKNRLRESIKIWINDDNVIFRNRLIKQLREITIPYIQTILNQGVSEKSMIINEILETSVLIFDLGVTLRDRIMSEILKNQQSDQRLKSVVNRYETCIERMLYLPEGELKFFDLDYFV